MPTTIRLKRVGRKKQPTFRIVVTDSARANDGPSIERLGLYNPRTDPSLLELNAARALHWLREGAEVSDTVKSLFRKAGVWEKFHAGVAPEELEEAEVVLGPPEGERRTSRRPEPGSQPAAAKEHPAAGAKAGTASAAGATGEGTMRAAQAATPPEVEQAIDAEAEAESAAQMETEVADATDEAVATADVEEEGGGAAEEAELAATEAVAAEAATDPEAAAEAEAAKAEAAEDPAARAAGGTPATDKVKEASAATAEEAAEEAEEEEETGGEEAAAEEDEEKAEA